VVAIKAEQNCCARGQAYDLSGVLFEPFCGRVEALHCIDCRGGFVFDCHDTLDAVDQFTELLADGDVVVALRLR